MADGFIKQTNPPFENFVYINTSPPSIFIALSFHPILLSLLIDFLNTQPPNIGYYIIYTKGIIKTI